MHAGPDRLSATAVQTKLPVIVHDVCAEGAAGMLGGHTSWHMRGKLLSVFRQYWQCRLLALLLGNAVHPSCILADARHANANTPKHPGSPTTPAAQLADRSELVRAAAGALAAKGDAANPHALASAVRAMARLGAPAILAQSALLDCFALPCPDLGVCFAQRPWRPAGATDASDRDQPVHLWR